MLFSIGHSNLPAEKFVALLKAHEVTLLGDVRSKPFSRWNPQFNRGALMGTLLRSGIVYTWYPILGGLDDTPVDAPEFVSALDELAQAARDQHVALMCSEADPRQCHRASKLGAWLASNRAISLSHITTNGLLTQAQVEVHRRQRPGHGGPKQRKLL